MTRQQETGLEKAQRINRDIQRRNEIVLELIQESRQGDIAIGEETVGETVARRMATGGRSSQ